MRILVTGSKGIIGLKLLSELKARGHSVFGIDILHHQGEVGFIQKMSHEEWTYSRCDIGEFRQIERIVTQAGPFDMIFNCAAEFGRWNGEDYYEQLWHTNCVGLKNLIRLQEMHGFRLVHFSSSEIYGDWQDVMTEDIMTEKAIPQLNDYAITKWANEMQLRNSQALYDTKHVIVRLFNTYGPGEFYHPYRSVNCKFCYHALMNLPITVFKDHYRSSTYVDDCVKTLSNITDNFKPGAVYNIGSTQYHDIETLADLIWNYTGASRELIEYKESEQLTTKIKKIDNQKAVTDLNHTETVSLKDGVEKTIDWMRKHYRL